MPVPVRLLGRPRVGGAGQSCRQPRGLKSWALLARIALSQRPVARRELAAELFPEADDPLGALRWSLADLRDSLASPTALRGDPLRVTAEDVWLDVWALEAGALPAADIGGVLLEGVDPCHCPGFETWLLLARSRCAARCREELRRHALELLAAGDAESAVAVGGRAAGLDPLDEAAQELLLRALVAAGRAAQASVHLAACTATFAREGLVPSPAWRAAVSSERSQPRSGVRAAVTAGALLRAGTAALDAGAADAGVETLRRAAEEAGRARDAVLSAQVLAALGSALVHAVRGFDGEGAVVLHRALVAARTARRADLVAEILRELAFVDVQAGRHASAERVLREAVESAESLGNDGLTARILAVQGMNEADRGRHVTAATLLSRSAESARRSGKSRQQAWSLGVLARSLLLSGSRVQARAAADASVQLARQERWNAFLPWPQVLRAEASMQAGDWDAAREDVEEAFALGCELGDPCWEGMAGRALALIAAHDGDHRAARTWITEARRRCDRVPDRYAWVSAYIGLADVELSWGDRVIAAAARLHDDAVRADLPEFLAWALVHQAESGDHSQVPLARSLAADIANPVLHDRIQALDGGPGAGATA